MNYLAFFKEIYTNAKEIVPYHAVEWILSRLRCCTETQIFLKNYPEIACSHGINYTNPKNVEHQCTYIRITVQMACRVEISDRTVHSTTALWVPYSSTPLHYRNEEINQAEITHISNPNVAQWAIHTASRENSLARPRKRKKKKHESCAPHPTSSLSLACGFLRARRLNAAYRRVSS